MDLKNVNHDTDIENEMLDDADAYERGRQMMDAMWMIENCDCDYNEDTDEHDHQCATQLSDDEIVKLGKEE